MFLENIRIKEAKAVLKGTAVMTRGAIGALLAYYALAFLNALVEGFSVILLVDLITGRSGLTDQGPVVRLIMSFIQSSGMDAGFTRVYLFLTGLFLLRVVLHFAYTYLDGYFEARMRRAVQEKGFAGIVSGDWETLRDVRVGERIGAITEEGSNVAKYFMAAVRSLYSLLVLGVLSFLALTVSLEMSLLFIAIGLPVLVVLKRLFNTQARIAERLVAERQGFYAFITERLNGLFQIKVEGAQDMHIGESLKCQERLTSLEVRWWRLRAYIYAFNALLPAIVFMAGYFFSLATGEPMRDVIGLMAGVGLIGARALAQLNQLTSNIGNITGYAGSILPVYALFSIRKERGKKPVPEKVAGVEARDVSYFYGERAAVKRISVRAAVKRPLILMGASGSGKSTLANILSGVYMPSAGEVRYTGESGKPYISNEYRPRVGYVTQDIHLFHGTIRDNLAPAPHGKGDEWLWQRLKMAGADGFVAAMGGLDAAVSEAGRSLSGGQKRRLGIARVLTAMPDILILDEVTAGLDAELKDSLVETIKELSTSLVVVIITHDIDLDIAGQGIGSVYTFGAEPS